MQIWENWEIIHNMLCLQLGKIECRTLTRWYSHYWSQFVLTYFRFPLPQERNLKLDTCAWHPHNKVWSYEPLRTASNNPLIQHETITSSFTTCDVRRLRYVGPVRLCVCCVSNIGSSEGGKGWLISQFAWVLQSERRDDEFKMFDCYFVSVAHRSLPLD